MKQNDRMSRRTWPIDVWRRQIVRDWWGFWLVRSLVLLFHVPHCVMEAKQEMMVVDACAQADTGAGMKKRRRNKKRRYVSEDGPKNIIHSKQYAPPPQFCLGEMLRDADRWKDGYYNQSKGKQEGHRKFDFPYRRALRRDAMRRSIAS